MHAPGDLYTRGVCVRGYVPLRQMTKLSDWTSGDNDLEYRYSDIGQVTKLIDYDDEDLIYAYDAVGRVTSMTDYHGAETAYVYDDGGRLTLLTAPGDKEWEFAYNPPSADFQHLSQPTETYNPYGSASKSLGGFQCNLLGGDSNKTNPDGTVETFGGPSATTSATAWPGATWAPKPPAARTWRNSSMSWTPWVTSRKPRSWTARSGSTNTTRAIT